MWAVQLYIVLSFFFLQVILVDEHKKELLEDLEII